MRKKSKKISRNPFVRQPVLSYWELQEFTNRESYFRKDLILANNCVTEIRAFFLRFTMKCKEINRFYKFDDAKFLRFQRVKWYRTIIILNSIAGDWRKYVDFLFDRRKNSRKGNHYVPTVKHILSQTNLENYFSYLSNEKDRQELIKKEQEILKDKTAIEIAKHEQDEYALGLLMKMRGITRQQALEIPGVVGFLVSEGAKDGNGKSGL